MDEKKKALVGEKTYLLQQNHFFQQDGESGSINRVESDAEVIQTETGVVVAQDDDTLDDFGDDQNDEEKLLPAVSPGLYRQVVHFVAKDLDDHRPFNKWGWTKNFTAGFIFVLHKLWFPAFTIMLIRDLVAYAACPQDRYVTTPLQILAGTAGNQITITSNYGTDLVADTTLYPLAAWVTAVALPIGGALWMATPTRNVIKKCWNYLPGHQKVERVYSYYAAWKNDQATVGPTRKDLFLLLTPFLVFSNVRLLWLWIHKIMGRVDYDNAYAACVAQNKLYIFLKDYGTYQCVVVDWPFIADKDKFTNDDALRAFLSTMQDPEFILSKIGDVLRAKPDLQVIDLEKQNWVDGWTPAQCRNFLTTFSSKLKSLQIFSGPGLIARNSFPDDGRMDALVDFFKQVSTEQVILNNLGLGDSQFAKLTPVLPGFSRLEVRANQIQDLSPLTNNTEKLETIIIDDNPTGDFGGQVLAGELSTGKSVLRKIGAQRTGMYEDGFNAIGGALPQSKLEEFDGGGNHFSQADFHAFGCGAANSTLRKINLADSEVNGAQATALVSAAKNGNLTSVTLSKNNFGADGTVNFVVATGKGSIKSVVVDEIPVGDAGVEVIAGELNQTNVDGLGLHKAQVNSGGFKALISKPTLKRLDVSGNPHGDDFASSLSTIPNNLEEINLGATGMSKAGAKNIAKAISSPTSTLRVLIVTDNGLPDEALAAIIDALPFSKVEVFTVNGNSMGPLATAALLNAMPKWIVKEFNFRNTSITNENFKQFVRALLIPTPHGEQIGGDLSIDQARDMHDSSRTRPATSLIKFDARDNDLGFSSQRACEQVMSCIDIEYKIGNSTQRSSRNRSFFGSRSDTSRDIALQRPPIPVGGNTNTNANGSALILGATQVPIILLVCVTFGALAGLYLLYRVTRNAFSKPNSDENSLEGTRSCSKK